jgi:hypothetical protein
MFVNSFEKERTIQTSVLQLAVLVNGAALGTAECRVIRTLKQLG